MAKKFELNKDYKKEIENLSEAHRIYLLNKEKALNQQFNFHSKLLPKFMDKLKSLKVFAGTGEPQKAEMKLDIDGQINSASETGDGPVDAIFKCIKNLYPHDVNLQLYQVHAVTEGTDAQATVSVRIEENGKTTVGQAADTDTLVASANAYIAALNKMIIKRDKTAPMMEQEKEKVRGI